METSENGGKDVPMVGMNNVGSGEQFDSTWTLSRRVTARRVIWRMLEGHEAASTCERRLHLAYCVFSCALVLSLFFLDAIDSATPNGLTGDGWYTRVEIVVMVIFSVEYCTRIFACVEDPDRPGHGARGDQPGGVWQWRIRTMLRPIMLSDLVALCGLGYDLVGQGNSESRVAGILRVFRALFTCYKMNREFHFLRLVVQVIVLRGQELFATLFIAVMLLLVSATVMNYIEQGEHSMMPTTFDAMWWAAAALTTVGYGDVSPVSPLGKLFGAVVAFVGVGLFAMPAGIIASGFQEAFNDRNCRQESSSRDELRSVEQIDAGYGSVRLEERIDRLQADMSQMRREQQEILELLRQRS